MLGIKEWNLDSMMFTYLWSPFKWIGKQLLFLRSNGISGVLFVTAIAAVIIGYTNRQIVSGTGSSVPIILMSIALLVILFAFSFRQSALKAWIYLFTGHLFIIAAVIFNTAHINAIEIVFYFSGIFLAFLLGLYCLQKIKAVDNDISLNRFHGYVYEQETTGFLFLVSAMGILGFPLTAAFIGIDVFFTYVNSNQYVLIMLMALCFVFIELSAFRILLRIFMGPHKKLDHPVAFRSS